jgi:DNA-directed RNA polymerase subunit RPC12/RpoP
MAVPHKRVYRSGARFDCAECGKLLRDDDEHSVIVKGGCPSCRGDLRLVAVGEDMQLVGDARWFRCMACKVLYMQRRSELVPTQPRMGFKEFTQFP